MEDDEKPHFAPGSPKRVWKPKSQRKAWPMFDMLIDTSIHSDGTSIPTWNRLRSLSCMMIGRRRYSKVERRIVEVPDFRGQGDDGEEGGKISRELTGRCKTNTW